MPSTLTLPERLFQVYCLFNRVDRDVSIDAIHDELFPEDSYGVLPRNRQQRIGCYIARLNDKLHPERLRIEPGVARRTYRLVATR